MMFKYPKLEADDCAAILTKDIVKKYPQEMIKTKISDMDYLQLAKDNVELYDLKYKKLTEKLVSIMPKRTYLLRYLRNKSDNKI